MKIINQNGNNNENNMSCSNQEKKAGTKLYLGETSKGGQIRQPNGNNVRKQSSTGSIKEVWAYQWQNPSPMILYLRKATPWILNGQSTNIFLPTKLKYN